MYWLRPEDMRVREVVNTVIIGASAAGLATSACLGRAGIEHLILEREDAVAMPWRRHYRRLRLHTSRLFSSLPYRPMPTSYPKYPARAQVVEYLETYARDLCVEPLFKTEVESLRRGGDGLWALTTSRGTWRAHNVVVATGYAHTPVVPTFPGQASFPGPICHSSAYVDGTPYRGQRVLVVGFGNSGGEIAIDLYEHGARPAVSVRGPVNVVQRDIFGLPLLGLTLALGAVSSRLADAIARPILNLLIGDLRPFGLRRLPYGPITQVREHGRVPLLDIGTVELIKSGHLRVLPGIRGFDGAEVELADGLRERFDAVVMATGYRPNLTAFLEPEPTILDAAGHPHESGTMIVPGLAFCGFYVSATGMLREIGTEARQIAAAIAGRDAGARAR